MNTLSMETGYESKRVAHLSLDFPEGMKYGRVRKAGFVQELRRRISALPGVVAVYKRQSAGRQQLSPGRPPGGSGNIGRTASPKSFFTTSTFREIIFRHCPLFAGRSFQEPRSSPEHSIILSESAARQLWPGDNPLGRGLRLGPVDERSHSGSELTADGPAYFVIGIARDTRGVEFDSSDSRQVYLQLAEQDIARFKTTV